MKVVFKKIIFKNILSYGNSLNEFVFDDGLNSITGKNGSGKSSICEILSFALFGSPYRKVKIAELINRTNGKNLYTEVFFDIDSDSYQIIRGLKPNIFHIYKNGAELELLSSKRLIQDEVDEILGINHELFKQIIALAVNGHKQFLTLSAGDKRDLVETIFHIDTFGLMLREVKQKLSALKSDIHIASKEHDILDSTIETLTKTKTRYETALQNFDRDKELAIAKFDSDIKSHNDRIEKCKTNIKTAEDYLILNKVIIDSPTGEEELSKLNSEVQEINHTIRHLNDRSNMLCDDTCPVCKTEISVEDKHKNLRDIESDIEKLTERRSKLFFEQVELQNSIEISKDIKELAQKAKQAIDGENERINRLLENIEMLETNKKLEQDRKPMFEVSEIEQDIVENGEKLTTNNQLLDSLNHTRYIQSQMETILSDDGIKSHFLNKLLPILNDKINYYLDKFEMSVIFSFDNLLNESIRPIGSREDVSYMSCSEGEKKRIDISILLSFIDIIKSISTWDCNLLFIDELFDSAVDGDNLGLILNSLKEHTLQNKKLCVYLISHRAYENGGLLDKVVEIKKEGSFSRIVKGS